MYHLNPPQLFAKQVWSIEQSVLDNKIRPWLCNRKMQNSMFFGNCDSNLWIVSTHHNSIFFPMHHCTFSDFNRLPNHLMFYWTLYSTLLKTLWVKETLLLNSIFIFFHNTFHSLRDNQYLFCYFIIRKCPIWSGLTVAE